MKAARRRSAVSDPVERARQQVGHHLGIHVADGGEEGLVVGDPGVVAAHLAAQALEAGAGHELGTDLGVIAIAPLEDVVQPPAELGGDGGVVEDPRAVEIVHVVHRVGDVVGEVHHRAFDALAEGLGIHSLPGFDEIGEVEVVGRVLVNAVRAVGGATDAAGRADPFDVGGVDRRCPRVLRRGRADGGGEIEPARGVLDHVEAVRMR